MEKAAGDHSCIRCSVAVPSPSSSPSLPLPVVLSLSLSAPEPPGARRGPPSQASTLLSPRAQAH
eukprot:12017869-Alexandrium_andersonii.AAC.1